MLRWLAGLAISMFVLCATGNAAEPVDVALVLVTDVSRSIDDSEFLLEKRGYAEAFSDPRVLAGVRGGVSGSIAVSYVEFAGSAEIATVVDWTIIRDEASAKAFGDMLLKAPRSAYGRTAIGAGIQRGIKQLEGIPYTAARRVIDVCGDGTNNSGPDVNEIRDEALAAGISINGLAIINDHPASWTYAHVAPPGGLANYYRDHVSGGAESFVLEIHDFASFRDAMSRKLIDEIAGLPAIHS